MNIEMLESLRKKRLYLFILTIIISLMLFLIYLFILNYFKPAPEYIVMSILFPCALLSLDVLIICCCAFSFESIVKENLMKKILDEIIQDNGEINWNYKKDILEAEFGGFLKLCLDKNWRGITIIPNDQFYGVYKGAKFSASEIKFTRRDRPLGGRSVERVCYRGIIIEIELNDKNFSPVIFKRRFSAYPLIIKKFKKALSQKLIGRKYNMYIYKGGTYQNFPSPFYRYLSSVNKNVSFGFVEDRAIIIYPSDFDMFKLGSIFKRVDDEKQYLKFRDEFQFMLSIIGRLSKIMNESEYE